MRANADTPAAAEDTVRLGAEGIGLCRTEHMFFDDERIDAMRRMNLADDEAAFGLLPNGERRVYVACWHPCETTQY